MTDPPSSFPWIKLMRCSLGAAHPRKFFPLRGSWTTHLYAIYAGLHKTSSSFKSLPWRCNRSSIPTSCRGSPAPTRLRNASPGRAAPERRPVRSLPLGTAKQAWSNGDGLRMMFFFKFFGGWLIYGNASAWVCSRLLIPVHDNLEDCLRCAVSVAFLFPTTSSDIVYFDILMLYYIDNIIWSFHYRFSNPVSTWHRNSYVRRNAWMWVRFGRCGWKTTSPIWSNLAAWSLEVGKKMGGWGYLCWSPSSGKTVFMSLGASDLCFCFNVFLQLCAYK